MRSFLHTPLLSPGPVADVAAEEPYPLWRQYLWRIVPGLVLFVAGLVTLAAIGIDEMIDGIYLELAEARADTIASLLEREAPEAWRELLSGRPPAEIWAGPQGETLRRAIDEALGGGRIERLKIYDPRGIILYSERAAEIGRPEHNAALDGVIRRGARTLVPKQEPEGPVYELYVPYRTEEGSLRAVFELYERRVYLDSILWSSLLPATLFPGILFLLLIGWLTALVSRAQAAIDRRTRALAGLKRQLERFVSRDAGLAARQVLTGGEVRSRRDRQTLFYSDVRDFSGLAETLPAEAVVAFLNRMLAIQVERIGAHGGDVDKMIGDAVFARFAGPDRAARALAAARDILRRLRKERDLPRAIGIGLYDGEVIIGAVGPRDRQDFTAIGDAVNVAARLCSAAGEGELVVESETLDAAGVEDGFGPPEELMVKGRRGRLRVRRWRG